MKGDEDFDTKDDDSGIVDRLFDDTPTEEEKEIDEDKAGEDTETDDEEESEDGESEDAETEDEEGESEDEETEDVDPDDYDADFKDKKKKSETKQPDPEEEPKDETMARKMAKENGRKFKEESAAHQTTKLELQRQADRIAQLEKDLTDTKRVRIQPMEDPEYRKLHESVMTNVRESSELIDGVKGVPNHFGGFVTKYLDARKAEDRDQAISDLKAEIIDKCVIKDVPYDEMDDTEKRDADKAANKVMSLLRANADQVQQAVELARKLKDDAEEGSFVLREREYAAAKAEIDPVLEGLGTLADDVIEANPHAIESIVAALIRDNPAAKGRATKLKADLAEVFAGLRPLTKAETEKLKREGADIKEFESERRKAHKSKKERFLAMAFHGIMGRPLLPSMAKELATLKGAKESEESEIDTLINRTKKRGPKKPAPKKPAKAGTEARAALIGGEWDDDDDD